MNWQHELMGTAVDVMVLRLLRSVLSSGFIPGSHPSSQSAVSSHQGNLLDDPRINAVIFKADEGGENGDGMGGGGPASNQGGVGIGGAAGVGGVGGSNKRARGSVGAAFPGGGGGGGGGGDGFSPGALAGFLAGMSGGGGGVPGGVGHSSMAGGFSVPSNAFKVSGGCLQSY